MTTHLQLPLSGHPWLDEPVDVDVGVAQLLAVLWRAGVPTLHSCQDFAECGTHISIGMGLGDLDRFWSATVDLRGEDPPGHEHFDLTNREQPIPPGLRDTPEWEQWERRWWEPINLTTHRPAPHQWQVDAYFGGNLTGHPPLGHLLIPHEDIDELAEHLVGHEATP